MILIIDNKGQYVHRIKRTLGEINVEAEIVPNTTEIEKIKEKHPEGIILSGGPYSAWEKEKLGNCDKIIELCMESDTPILGICLGHQIIASHFNGKIEKGKISEYSKVEIKIIEEDDIFKRLGKEITVWESHNDEVVEIPENFIWLAYSEICKYEAIKHKERKIYGVQFHPEVAHTPKGAEILKNFVDLCKTK